MKALIIYALIWFLVLAAGAGVNLTGNSGEAVETLFGFIYLTLFFAATVMLRPFWVDRRHSPKYRAA